MSMSKNGKILLGIGGVLLALIVVCGVAGKLAMDFAEKRLVEGSKPDIDAGVEFAKTTDQKGCMDEGLKRARAITLVDFGKGMSLDTFLVSCLKGAKPTQDFCVGVPGYWSMKDTEWKQAECKKAGLDEKKSGCIYVFQAKYSICSPASN